MVTCPHCKKDIDEPIEPDGEAVNWQIIDEEDLKKYVTIGKIYKAWIVLGKRYDDKITVVNRIIEVIEGTYDARNS